MTRARQDSHSTEFGLWLRNVRELDSQLGYVATNVDYIWSNYKTGEWMLIEEKRFMSDIKRWQKSLFAITHRCALSDCKYKGFVFLQFQNTSPDDGNIYWNRECIHKSELVVRLKNLSHGCLLSDISRL